MKVYFNFILLHFSSVLLKNVVPSSDWERTSEVIINRQCAGQCEANWGHRASTVACCRLLTVNAVGKGSTTHDASWRPKKRPFQPFCQSAV